MILRVSLLQRLLHCLNAHQSRPPGQPPLHYHLISYTKMLYLQECESCRVICPPLRLRCFHTSASCLLLTAVNRLAVHTHGVLALQMRLDKSHILIKMILNPAVCSQLAGAVPSLSLQSLKAGPKCCQASISTYSAAFHSKCGQYNQHCCVSLTLK